MAEILIGFFGIIVCLVLLGLAICGALGLWFIILRYHMSLLALAFIIGSIGFLQQANNISIGIGLFFDLVAVLVIWGDLKDN